MRLRQESGRFLAQSHKKFEIAPELITNNEDTTHTLHNANFERKRATCIAYYHRFSQKPETNIFLLE